MKTLRENGDRGRQLLVSAVGAMAKEDWTADVKELQVHTQKCLRVHWWIMH